LAFKTVPPTDFKAEDLHVFYNLTLAVGPGQSNQPDDVMLVQLCLQKIYSNPTLFRPPANGKTVKADGKFGPITQAGILHFQKEIRRQGATTRVDGIVNRGNAFTSRGEMTHRVLTIFWLNLGLKKTIGDELFSHLESNSDTPFALAVALAASSV
jgi:peptidoglycan hydrolase-like protein with peptidoglycan-binding domain